MGGWVPEGSEDAPDGGQLAHHIRELVLVQVQAVACTRFGFRVSGFGFRVSGSPTTFVNSAPRLLYHSTLGLKVIKKRRRLFVVRVQAVLWKDCCSDSGSPLQKLLSRIKSCCSDSDNSLLKLLFRFRLFPTRVARAQNLLLCLLLLLLYYSQA